MSNSPGSSDGCPRSRASIIRFALILVGLVALAVTSIGSARARPECFGRTATIVGTAGSNNIKGTARKDVIYAGGGNDTIQAPSGPGNQGNDIICGGPAVPQASVTQLQSRIVTVRKWMGAAQH